MSFKNSLIKHKYATLISFSIALSLFTITTDLSSQSDIGKHFWIFILWGVAIYGYLSAQKDD